MKYNVRKSNCIFISLLIFFIWIGFGIIENVYCQTTTSTDKTAKIICSLKIASIIEIDRKSTSDLETGFFSGAIEFELTEGKHIVTAVFPTYEERTLQFEVEAGHEYQLDRWGDELVLTDDEYEKSWEEYSEKLTDGTSGELNNKPIKWFVAPAPDPKRAIVRSLVDNPYIRIASIDNKSYPSICPGFALKMKPGTHVFEVWFKKPEFFGNLYSPATQEITLYLEPGRRYLLYVLIDSENQLWKPFCELDNSFEFPDSAFAYEAKRQLDILEAPRKEFENAQKENTLDSYRNFLQKYPKSEFTLDAEQQIRSFVLREMTLDDLLPLFNKKGISGEYRKYDNNKALFQGASCVILLNRFDETSLIKMKNIEENLLDELPLKLDTYCKYFEYGPVGSKLIKKRNDFEMGILIDFESFENNNCFKRDFAQPDTKVGYKELFHFRIDPFYICGVAKDTSVFENILSIISDISK